MKILFFSKMFPRPDNESFGTYVYAQINEIINIGVEVIIVSPHMYLPRMFAVLGGKFRRYATASKIYEYKGIKIYSPPCLWAKELLNNVQDIKYYLYEISLKKYMDNIIRENKPDIIYSVDPVLDGRFCIYLGEKYNIPVVLIEHNVPSNYRNFVGNRKAIRTYGETVKKADSTIFVTNRQKALFEELISEKIYGNVILNGFINEIKTNENQRRVRKVGDILNIIIVGFLEDRKGYPVLFRTLSKFKASGGKFHLEILGDGYDRDRYKNMVNELSIDKECKFKGIVNHEEVFKAMLRNDLFVLPSYEESFGIVYLEAMSCGLPIIGTEDEGISDIVNNGVNGFLVKKNDEEGLLRTIQYIADNPDEAAIVAEKGKQTTENLNWNRNAEKVIDIFRQVLSQNNKNII